MCPTDNLTPETKNIAWNRLSISVPESWEIDGLALNHMLLGDGSAALMEIRWETLQAGCSLDGHVKRFIRQAEKQLSMVVKPSKDSAPSLPWHKDAEVIGFSWERAGLKGSGAFLFCRECRCFSAIRFLPGISSMPERILEDIAASFRDHPAGNHISWTVFGLDVDLDSRLDLKTFSFNPGCYSMAFEAPGGIHFTLYSWGPASVLLSDRSLEDFAAQTFRDTMGDPVVNRAGESECLVWTRIQHSAFPARFLDRILGRICGTVVHKVFNNIRKNRISGIRLEMPGGVGSRSAMELAHVRF
ncbi:MAG: hypothetical protein V1793_03060 [Pseudomonadota bacterium]